MGKIRKIRDFYTLDPKLYEIFLKHIEEKNLDKSKLIESLIKTYMEKHEKV